MDKDLEERFLELEHKINGLNYSLAEFERKINEFREKFYGGYKIEKEIEKND